MASISTTESGLKATFAKSNDRIGSDATRPEQFVAVPDVDVVINDNHVTRQQSSGKDVECADYY
jgi:hypothetical protein